MKTEFFQVKLDGVRDPDFVVPFVPSSNARVKLVGFQVGLTTDATVGNRLFYLTLGRKDWPDGIGGITKESGGVPESSTGTVYGLIDGFSSTTAGSTDYVKLPDIWLPNDARFMAGFIAAGTGDSGNWVFTFCRELLD